jgi:hypothetical protein
VEFEMQVFDSLPNAAFADVAAVGSLNAQAVNSAAHAANRPVNSVVGNMRFIFGAFSHGT